MVFVKAFRPTMLYGMLRQQPIVTSFKMLNSSFLVFVGYKKAFGTICHNYGICGPALNLISFYINYRSQVVNINGSFSSPKKLNYSVPQGSILSPLLFFDLCKRHSQYCLSIHKRRHETKIC